MEQGIRTCAHAWSCITHYHVHVHNFIILSHIHIHIHIHMHILANYTELFAGLARFASGIVAKLVNLQSRVVKWMSKEDIHAEVFDSVEYR